METINKYRVSAILVLALCLSSCLRVDEDEFDFKIEPTGTAYGHAYVDLGLSVKWATCNVGATAPEKAGDYYAWGETEPKSSYSYDNYYYDDSDYDSDWSVLPLDRDAAAVNWGGAWRMPTNEEWEELLANCTWTTIWCNGAGGYKVTSKINGNSIFLPAAGFRFDDDLLDAGYFGYYWSSSLGTDYPYDAWYVVFGSGGVFRDDSGRCFGRSVRPVLLGE